MGELFFGGGGDIVKLNAWLLINLVMAFPRLHEAKETKEENVVEKALRGFDRSSGVNSPVVLMATENYPRRLGMK
jgi:hypothetical protein